jgi:phage shock protein C
MKLGKNKIICGVCSGIEQATGLDVTLIRLVFLLLMFFGYGSIILIYFLIAFLSDN